MIKCQILLNLKKICAQKPIAFFICLADANREDFVIFIHEVPQLFVIQKSVQQLNRRLKNIAIRYPVTVNTGSV